MADSGGNFVTIPDLPPGNLPLDGTELLWINQAGRDVSAALVDLTAVVPVGPPGPKGPPGDDGKDGPQGIQGVPGPPGSVSSVTSTTAALTVANGTTAPALTVVSAPKWTTARTLSFTGDTTGSGVLDGSANLAIGLTLAPAASNVGTFGDATHVAQVTVDSKGRVTAAASVAIPPAGTLTSVGLTAPSGFAVGNSPLMGTGGTLALTLISQAAGQVLASPAGAAGVPSFRGLQQSDIAGGVGVTSVGLALPSIFNVTNSPVNATGTLTGTLVSQAAGLVLASPSGAAGVPTFRALTAGDVSGLPTGTVTSVGLALPASMFTVTGSPVSGIGTLTGALSAQANNTVLAGPTTGGPSVPTFRQLGQSDINGGVGVTSVAMTAPAGFTVGGSPINGSGTLALGIASQAAGAVLAAPAGAAGVPTFRALTSGDIGGLGTFATQNYATPPIIGGTTPNVGNFSDVNAANGTAAVPSIGFISTANTGWFNDTSATPGIGGSVGGAEVFQQTAFGLNLLRGSGGITLNLQRQDTLTANDTVVGSYRGTANNSAGTSVIWGQIGVFSHIPTSGSEQGALQFDTVHPGNTTPSVDFTIQNGALYGGSGAAAIPLKLADSAGNLYASYSATGVTAANQASITFQRSSNLGGGAFIGQMVWSAPNNAGTVGSWAAIFAQARAVAPGSEEGGLLFQTSHPGSFGTLTTDLFIDNGNIYVGPGGTVLTGIKIADASGNLFGATVNATGNGTVAAPSLTVGNSAVGFYSNASNNILGFTSGAAQTIPVNLVGTGQFVFGTTTAPRVGASASSALNLAYSNTYAGINISRWDASAAGPILAIGKSRSTTIGTPGTAVQAGDIIGQITFSGDDGTTLNYAATVLTSTVLGVTGANLVQTALSIKTTPAMNDFTIAAGSLYAGGSTANKLLLDGVYSYGNPAPTWQRLASLNNFNVTASNSMGGIMFTPAATLATGALTMPSTPVDQQEWGLASSQAVTALTMSANTTVTAGQLLLGGLSTIAANGFARWKYFAATTTWYRIG